MQKYVLSKYVIAEEIASDIHLYYSSLSNQFVLLNNRYNKLIRLNDLDTLQNKEKGLFDTLLQNKIITSVDFDETSFITEERTKHIKNKDWYHIVINTTLDCNLNCWYCYEDRIKGSRISDEVIVNVCKNIEAHYSAFPYRILKLSFFGGEPFLYWNKIQTIIEYASHFCIEHSLELLLDFTTNATLIEKEMIDYLSSYNCHFQITLDGHEMKHNITKKSTNKDLNCYRKSIKVLKLINSKINTRNIGVRINFDSHVLKDIDDIIKDVSFLDRRKSYIIVKKVWQIGTDRVEKKQILDVLQKLFDNNFLADYYVMPKGGVCFAERVNQVLFNYDGRIFKCTTVKDFNIENSLGEYNSKTGLIEWNKSKIDTWTSNMQQTECLHCKWYGACYGPCNRQLIPNKGKFICTFDAMNLSQKEYLIYLFKYNYLMKKLYSDETML